MSFDSSGLPKPFLISQKIIEKIKEAEKHIYISMYTFTSIEIAEALVAQKTKNPLLKIEIIVDKFSMLPSGKAKYLAEHGIDIFLFEEKLFLQCLTNQSFVDLKPNKKQDDLPKKFSYQNYHEPLMHNKYLIIDNCFLTGSYNFSRKADLKNFENIILVEAQNKDEIESLENYISDFFNLKRFTSVIYINDFVKINKIIKSKKKHRIKINNSKKESNNVLLTMLGSKFIKKIKNIWSEILIFFI